MVTCNLCAKNKSVEEMQSPFRYVCIECWNDLKIEFKSRVIQGVAEPVDKDLIY